jgi:hypothetical protein
MGQQHNSANSISIILTRVSKAAARPVQGKAKGSGEQLGHSCLASHALRIFLSFFRFAGSHAMMGMANTDNTINEEANLC